MCWGVFELIENQYRQNIDLENYNKKLENTYTTVITQKNNRIIQLNKVVEQQANKVETLVSVSKVLKPNEKRKYLGQFELTYYCGEKYKHICGTGTGITKSGEQAVVGITVSVDPSVISLGTNLYIDGIGTRIAQDTGGAIKGNKIDVFVDTHANALKLGRTKNVDVWTIE